eukprot:snap_masked-scaffold_24-processed-gene-2.29-mRNA-1 protein AED:1.00 eAED:1.00 QI:0/-1/0/0/-1/1/1/0/98
MQIPIEYGVAILKSKQNLALAASHNTWRHKLSQIASGIMDKLQGKGTGFSTEKSQNVCEGCLEGKFNRKTQPHNNSTTFRKPLDLIVADSIGPSSQNI